MSRKFLPNDRRDVTELTRRFHVLSGRRYNTKPAGRRPGRTTERSLASRTSARVWSAPVRNEFCCAPVAQRLEQQTHNPKPPVSPIVTECHRLAKLRVSPVGHHSVTLHLSRESLQFSLHFFHAPKIGRLRCTALWVIVLRKGRRKIELTS